MQPRWLIGAFLAWASALREENALMSYGFLFPKACGGVGGDVGVHWLPFSFCQRCRFSLVGRQTGSPSGQPADGDIHLCCFSGRLDEGWKSDELMNGWLNILKATAIRTQHPFIKPLVKRKAMSKALCPFSLFISHILLLSVWWGCKPLLFFMFIYTLINSSK